jgi:hypothetical protein
VVDIVGRTVEVTEAAVVTSSPLAARLVDPRCATPADTPPAREVVDGDDIRASMRRYVG